MGILARQDHHGALERSKNYKNKVVNPILSAFQIFQDKCVMCWMNGEKSWVDHASDNCQKRTGTHYGDKEYVSFRSSAFKLPAGWCYSCLIKQVKIFILYIIDVYLLDYSFSSERYGSSFPIIGSMCLAWYFDKGNLHVH